MQWFLVDNERGKRLGIRIGDQSFSLGESSADGQLRQTVQVPVGIVGSQLAGTSLQYQSANPSADERTFRGQSFCLAATGVSVVSDIDDTIKQSNVLNKHELLRNTFLHEFRAVEGMPAAYARWAAEGVAFHYVSASPWQLYVPLSDWIEQTGFPRGSFHMRPFRLKDTSVLAMFGDPLTFKRVAIEPLLQAFPQRKFVLVGDSGERDPEVYGELARRYSAQVVRVYIRDITDEPRTAPRYLTAFAEVSPQVWHLFTDPGDLQLPD
jgi:phosphatidate phosphatase APP1